MDHLVVWKSQRACPGSLSEHHGLLEVNFLEAHRPTAIACLSAPYMGLIPTDHRGRLEADIMKAVRRHTHASGFCFGLRKRPWESLPVASSDSEGNSAMLSQHAMQDSVNGLEGVDPTCA